MIRRASSPAPPPFGKRLWDSFPKLLEFHKNHGVAPEEYRRVRRMAQLEFRASRAAIYLDTNWWVRMREVALGRSANAQDVSLFRALDLLVERGRVFVPPGEGVLLEFLRQTDGATRIESARLVDRWCHGLALVGQEQQAISEITGWLSSRFPGFARVDPPERLVWTYPAFVLMVPRIRARNVPADLNRLVMLAVEDLFGVTSFEELVASFTEGDPDFDEPTRTAARLNSTVGKVPAEKFRATYHDECLGYWRACWPFVLQAAKGAGIEIGLPYDALLLDVRQALGRDEIGVQLPAMRIIASLHASFRTDKGRQFKPGDWRDLNHAAIAVPYCDAFLTERSLCSSLLTRPVAAATRPSCAIMDSARDALAWLETLRNEASPSAHVELDDPAVG